MISPYIFKTTVLSLLIFFLYNDATAQITFEKIIDVNNDSNKGHDILISSDSTYVLVSDGYCPQEDGSDLDCTTIFKLDLEGNIIWQKSIVIYPNGRGIVGFPGASIISKDGGIVFVGETFIEGRDYDIFLCKLSSKGDSLWYKTYGGEKRDLARTMVETSDGGFAFSGITGSYGDTSGDAFLMKTDSLGNLLWVQTHGDKGQYELARVHIDTDGGFILSGYMYDEDRDRYSYVVKTDALGNEIWTQTYGVPMGKNYSARVKPASTGGYWMNARLDSTIRSDTLTMLGISYIAKLDELGTIEWQKNWIQNWQKEGIISELEDGNLIVIGLERYKPNFSNDVSGWLAKLTPQGDIIWERSYSRKSYISDTDPFTFDLSYFWNGKETLDGGFILAGEIVQYLDNKFHQDAWLLKLDQDGCLEPDCGNEIVLSHDENSEFDVPPIIAISPPPFTLYPQPSTSNIIHVELASNFQLKPQIQFRIYDLQGRLLFQQTITELLTSLNVSNLPKGLYYCELVESDGKVLGGRKLVR